MPDLFDILLSDVDEKILHNEILTALGSAYLSETPHLTSPHTTVDGIMFGLHDRVNFPLVVNIHKSRPYVIHSCMAVEVPTRSSHKKYVES